MKVHLVMPMGGAGSRFQRNGYELPKPIIEIEGRPFFYWAVRSIEKYVDLEDLTFVVLQDHVTRFALDNLIYQYFPSAEIVIVPEVTPGPVFTCLEGLKNIQDDKPVVFNDCDHMFRSTELNNMLAEATMDIDGALVTFESRIPHFSYVRYNDNGTICGTVEKEVVSDRAICGAYIYKSAELFRNVAKEYLLNCPYKESFLSGMYNVMCNHDMKVKDYHLDFHVEFGTPEEYEVAKGSVYFSELL